MSLFQFMKPILVTTTMILVINVFCLGMSWAFGYDSSPEHVIGIAALHIAMNRVVNL